MGKDVFINSTVVYLQWDRRVCKKDCGVLAMLNECRGEREWRWYSCRVLLPCKETARSLEEQYDAAGFRVEVHSTLLQNSLVWQELGLIYEENASCNFRVQLHRTYYTVLSERWLRMFWMNVLFLCSGIDNDDKSHDTLESGR